MTRQSNAASIQYTAHGNGLRAGCCTRSWTSVLNGCPSKALSANGGGKTGHNPRMTSSLRDDDSNGGNQLSAWLGLILVFVVLPLAVTSIVFL